MRHSERRELTRAEIADMAEQIQFHALAGLVDARRWEAGDVVFHGGSSLHFAYGSPRWSEDLDFLFNNGRSDDLHRIMEDVRAYVAEALYPEHDGAVDLKLAKDRADNPVLTYQLSWSRADRSGTVKVKVEFMRADIEQMLQYRHHLRNMQIPTGRVQVSPMMPTAVTDSVVADKVVALAFRPYTKERDHFDLWWLIDQQGCARPTDDPEVFCRQLDTTLAIYGQDRASFVEAVRAQQVDVDELAAAIERNVPQWLPESMGRQFGQHGVYRDMAAVARDTLEAAADTCRPPDPGHETADGRRP